MRSGISSLPSVRNRIQPARAAKLTHMAVFTYPDCVEVDDGPSVSEREKELQKLFIGPFRLDIELMTRIGTVLVQHHFHFDISIVRFEVTTAKTYYGSTNIKLDEHACARFVIKISKATCGNFVCLAATLAHEFIHIEINLRCRTPIEWDSSHGQNFFDRKAEFETLYPFMGDLIKC